MEKIVEVHTQGVVEILGVRLEMVVLVEEETILLSEEVTALVVADMTDLLREEVTEEDMGALMTEEVADLMIEEEEVVVDLQMTDLTVTLHMMIERGQVHFQKIPEEVLMIEGLQVVVTMTEDLY